MLLSLVAILLIAVCLCLLYILRMHRRKKAFLSHLSHEIRTPMNGIVGMSTLLGQTSLTKEQSCYLSTIRTCCDQLLQATDSTIHLPQLTRQKKATTIPRLANQYPLRILVAEDNVINQQLALILLKKMGYSPTIANNGKEVITYLDNGEFDLILMDVQMPEMDGIEATRAIRIKEGTQGRVCFTTIIIAMTANTTPEDREQCHAAGMNDFLSKPIDLPELVAMLKKWSSVTKHP